MPFFSILIPVYNVENYLNDCLDSVYNQDFSDYEVIIINDGSTDTSLEICKEYYLTHINNTTLINNTSNGLLLTRREAIKIAKGKYFIFLDSDDKLRDDALKLLFNCINNSDADMVLFNASCEESFSKSLRSLPYSNTYISEDYIDEIRKLVIKTGLLNNMWMKTVNRSIVDIDTDYTKFKHISNGEDLLQSLPLFTKAKSIYILDDNLYFYRYNPTGLTKSYKSSKYRSVRDSLIELKKYMKIWKLDDEMNVSYNNRCVDSIYSIITQLLISDYNKNNKYYFLKEIYEDLFFKELSFSIYNGSLKKKMILLLFRHHQFNILIFLSYLFKLFVYR